MRIKIWTLRGRGSAAQNETSVSSVLPSISFSSQAPWWAVPLTPRAVDPYETWCDSIEYLPPVPDSQNQTLLSLTWPKPSATTWHIHNQFCQLLGKSVPGCSSRRCNISDQTLSWLCHSPREKCPNRQAIGGNQQT